MTGVTIRGIYATALTKFFVDNGFKVSKPSKVISDRFGLKYDFDPKKIVIRDRSDQQGVKVESIDPQVDKIIDTLKDFLPDVIVREETQLSLDNISGRRLVFTPGFLSFDVEFPGGSKLFLDDLRNEVKPTLVGHHQLKTINSQRIDLRENLLNGSEKMRREISREVKEELVYSNLVEGCKVNFEHVKPDGQTLFLRPGKITSFTDGKLTLLRRGFKVGGLYNGVKILRKEGDYSITTVVEGQWFMKHSYYSYNADLKCEYYNINSPIEFYPNEIRYIDLEVDVVRENHGPSKIVDLDKLDLAISKGYISFPLAQKARKIAEDIINEIKVLE